MFVEHSQGKEYKKIHIQPCNLSSVVQYQIQET